MADETKKLPWGRYEHESGAWIQFKPGPYRYRDQREWRGAKEDLVLYLFIARRLESWRLVDGDGNELDLEAIRQLAIEATTVPPIDAGPEQVNAALAAIERFAGAFDNVEMPLLRWLVTSGSTFVYVDMLEGPKA